MTESKNAVLEAALALPISERVELANTLYESLPLEDDDLLVAELDCRLEEHIRGRDPGVPVEQMFRQLRERRT